MQGAAGKKSQVTEIGEESEARARLLEAMSDALVEKSYASITIADIARLARVSKRTFYEEFDDKEACFLACFAAMSEIALQTLESAADPSLPWDEQVRNATRQYLAALEGRPELTRALMVEIQSAGPKALALRREVLARFSRTLQKLARRGRERTPTLRPLSPSMAMAIVGGMNELILLAVEEGRAHKLTELADTAVELVQAVLLRPG